MTILCNSETELELISALRGHYWEAGLSSAFAAALARKCVEYGHGVPIVREGPHSTEQTQRAVITAAQDPAVRKLQNALNRERNVVAA